MNLLYERGEHQRLVTVEPVEFEKLAVEVKVETAWELPIILEESKAYTLV